MWFDSSSIANLAKNALKEAQRHIDNVLDIKEDDLVDATNKSGDDDDENISKISKSKTMPEIAIGNRDKNDKEESVWGSFNGSFFESSNTKSANQVTITYPPPPRKSETSSESLEVLSNKTSSDIRSSQSTLLGSGEEESVEIITPSNDSFNINNPDILSQDNLESDLSCDENALMTPDEVPSIPITNAPSHSIISQDVDNNSSVTTIISTSTLTNSETESFCDPSKEDFDNQSLKANIMEKSMESFEIQTNISDSTHSFEEINLKLKNIPSSDNGKRCSGHTSSGDELETATSSDIEIISSPNGDSSSTASCLALSPQKSCQVATFPYQNSESFLGNLQLDQHQHKFKGHSRELSEISVLSLASDGSSSPIEVERLLKRISELSENLEQREMQLIQIGKINTEMNQELESLKLGRTNIDMSNIQEEHTQRLSALEKKFQQSIRENAVLKNRLETLKVEAKSKVSSHEYEKMKNEQDFVIETLKQEGEKLSKQILQHSTAIKKLKSKLKENDEIIKRQDNIIADLTEENTKMKKNLIAKDEIEKSQLEGINKLTTEKRKFEKECHTLISQNEDLQQKLLAIQSSYDVVKKELNDRNLQLGKNLEEEKEKALNESKLLRKELNDLREVNRCNEQEASSQLQKLRQENMELKRKLELTEFRIEDQKQQASLASIPLIKQLESLQNILNQRTGQWEYQERALLKKLDDAEKQLASQTDIEKITKEQVSHLNIKISSLEEKLSLTSLKLEQTIGQLQQKEIESNLRENDLNLKIEQLSVELSNKSNECEKFKNLLEQAEEKFRLERHTFEEEKKKLLFVQQQNQNGQNQSIERRDSHENELIVNDSPVPSLVGSIESLSQHAWNIDDQDIAHSTYGSQYGGIVNSSASLMEGLQSILKQRDGELQQLQWEIHRLQTERNFLSTELSQLTAELEKATDHIREITEKQNKQEETQIQYDALLEMYGQKVEEYEELKLDLVDLKSISQMYKIQIDELTTKLNNKSFSDPV